ncbi:MAG: hypothetical protein V3T30_06445, partial [Thermodesulfobacteriota bacterium]
DDTLKVCHGHKGDVLAVAFSPDGNKLLSGGRDNKLILRDLSKGCNSSEKFGRVVAELNSDIKAVAFSPDGVFIGAGTSVGEVRLWPLDKAEPVVMKGHTGSVNSIAFHPNPKVKQLASGSEDGTVRLWDYKGKELKRWSGHTSEVTKIGFSKDRTRIISSGGIGGFDHTIRFNALSGKDFLAPLVGHTEGITSFALSRDGSTIISGGLDKTLRLWDMRGSLLKTFKGHSGSVWSVDAAPTGGELLASGADDGLRLWNINGEPTENSFQAEVTDIGAVKFSNDGKRVIVGDFGSVRYFDIENRRYEEPMKEELGWVKTIDRSASGHAVVSGDTNGNVAVIYPNKTKKPVVFEAEKEGFLYGVAVSPKGELIATGGDDASLNLWDFKGANKGGPFTGHKKTIHAVAFSPDGKTVATGSEDGTIRLWDSKDSKDKKPIVGHVNSVNALDFHPGGKKFVSGGSDGSLRIWNIYGQQIVAPFYGHLPDPDGGHAVVTTVAFTRDGKRVISGGLDGTVRVWSANWRDGFDMACERLKEHPVFKDPKTPADKAALESCKKHSRKFQ